jgi:hypothetical protein
VVDVRICGDPRLPTRFAFIEFIELAGAQAAKTRTGTLLGGYNIRVSRSKTAILPVNKELMPRWGREAQASHDLHDCLHVPACLLATRACSVPRSFPSQQWSNTGKWQEPLHGSQWQP